MSMPLSSQPAQFCIRRDTGFLVFSFPRSLGSGVYDEINGGQRKLVRTYLNYISTKFRPIWMRFGARVSKTPCQTLYPWVSVLARCFAYASTKSHPNQSKFGGDIAEINAHRFLLSPINFIINSTSQRPWEQKGQKTRVTPYSQQTRSQTKLVNRVPPPNRRTVRTQEPVGGTISVPCCEHPTRRLEPMAHGGFCSAQRPRQCHAGDHPKRSPLGVSTHPSPRSESGDKQSGGRTTPRNDGP